MQKIHRNLKHKLVILLLLVPLCVLTACQKKQTDSTESIEHLSESFLKTAEEGDEFLLGVFEQDNDPKNGWEDIEWVVLEKGDGYLTAISKYVIECMPFNESEEWIAIDWETCSLREWLNGDFYNEAFTDEEKAFISLTDLENAGSEYFGLSGGNDTQDYVYLIDKDTIEYLYEDIKIGISKITIGNESLESYISQPTEYEPLVARFTESAKQKCISVWGGLSDYSEVEKESGENCCYWWTRSKGDKEYSMLEVTMAGGITSCPAMSESVGVRPMISVQLN